MDMDKTVLDYNIFTLAGIWNKLAPAANTSQPAVVHTIELTQPEVTTLIESLREAISSRIEYRREMYGQESTADLPKATNGVQTT